MPVLWALANPKLGEREVLAAMLEEADDVVAEHPGVPMITDKGFSGRAFERTLREEHHATLLRPSRKDEAERGGEPMLKSVRQLIESVNDTLKGQLDLEQHGARTFEGVAIRVAQRVLAMAAADRGPEERDGHGGHLSEVEAHWRPASAREGEPAELRTVRSNSSASS